MKKRFSILAVGTELTMGETLNRNAEWISKELTERGLVSRFQMTVPDDDDAILRGLLFLTPKSDLLIVTGGLGPTSDDFTRNLIAKFTGKKLSYHEPSWTKIEERLTARGIPVTETNRQQCFFPEGARILPNAAGTADAFIVESEIPTIIIAAIPGPPNEGKTIFKDHFYAYLDEKAFAAKPTPVIRYFTLGLSESAISEKVEALIKGLPVTVGYRASPPFIEIKIFAAGEFSEKSQIAFTLEPSIQTLDQALREEFGDALFSVGVYDAAEHFLRALSIRLAATSERKSISFVDELTDGRLFARLLDVKYATRLNEIRDRADLYFSTAKTPVAATHTFKLQGLTRSIYSTGGVEQEFFWKNPYAQALLRDRAEKLALEKSLQLWGAWLEA